MASVSNRTNQPVVICLKDGVGFHLAPHQVRTDFPETELDGPFFQPLVQNLIVEVVAQPSEAPSTSN